MNLLLKNAVGLLAVLLLPCSNPTNAQTNIQPAPEQSTAILNTSVLFAIGAQEADQALRGSFGWPTFQEGFVEGVYFRFDPDGFARFSPSPRLDEDVFEAICANASTACIAKKGILEIGLTPAGQVQIRINGITPTDGIFVSDRTSELPLPTSILEPLTPRLESLLSGGGELIVKREIEVVQSVSLLGFSAVATYLRWVAQNQSPRVFPRGWPVPAQSQNQLSSGLTQPNQWTPPNTGPQAAETTWHIQKRLPKNTPYPPNITSTYSQNNRHEANNIQNQQFNQDFNQVGNLQQQIIQLQNNLQQIQSRTIIPSTNLSTNSTRLAARYPPEELQEFGQSFAQQAQGRNLPASPGGLGVGGDSTSITTNYQNSTFPFNLTAQSNSRLLQLKNQENFKQTHKTLQLEKRVALLENSLQEMHHFFSLQLLKIEERIIEPSERNVIRGGAILQKSSSSASTPTRYLSQKKLSPSNSTSLEELEKKLLSRLNSQDLGTPSIQPIVSHDSGSVSVNRQIIEDILNELSKEEPLSSAKNTSASTQDSPVIANDQFVTLNDYIKRVLQSKDRREDDHNR